MVVVVGRRSASSSSSNRSDESELVDEVSCEMLDSIDDAAVRSTENNVISIR